MKNALPDIPMEYIPLNDDLTYNFTQLTNNLLQAAKDDDSVKIKTTLKHLVDHAQFFSWAERNSTLSDEQADKIYNLTMANKGLMAEIKQLRAGK